MFCTRCGKEIPREARFCGNCGAPVFSESFPAEERRPSGNNMAQQSPAEAAVGANRGYAAAAAPTVPCEASPAPAYPQRPKKKIPVWVWITVGVVALLIAATFGISRLLNRFEEKKADNVRPAVPESTYTDSGTPPEEEEIPSPVEEELPLFPSAYPELSLEYEDFLNSKSFNKAAPLGEDEILYMGEAFYDGIGQCHVTFVLSADRRSIKNFAIYLDEISLKPERNGITYDLAGVSIRQDFTNTYEYEEDYVTIPVGGHSLSDFVLDTAEYAFAFGVLDYDMSYYAPGSTSPIVIELGSSDIVFSPVRIG